MGIQPPQIGPKSPEEADIKGINPFRDSVMHQCPHMYFRRMQQETPLYDVEGTDVHIVTRHELIVPIAALTSAQIPSASAISSSWVRTTSVGLSVGTGSDSLSPPPHPATTTPPTIAIATEALARLFPALNTASKVTTGTVERTGLGTEKRLGR